MSGLTVEPRQWETVSTEVRPDGLVTRTRRIDSSVQTEAVSVQAESGLVVLQVGPPEARSFVWEVKRIALTADEAEHLAGLLNAGANYLRKPEPAR